jgi:uncharacterized protein (DUF2141 family)
MGLTVSGTYCATSKRLFTAALAVIVGSLAVVQPAEAQYRRKISNDLGECKGGEGPAVRVVVSGIRSSRGTLRVQSYRATAADWLQKGRWINRVEVPARAGTMTFCLPVPGAGSYAIAVRHDANGNGETDLTQDGGGMSNNPSINIFNLGKPSFRKTAFAVGDDVKSISIVMKYM